MAKKKKSFLKVVVGVSAAAVAGKVAYDKLKATKSRLTKEEQESAELEVRKYNAICEKRMVDVEDEEFMGCEVKAIASKLTVDLSLAVFEKDVYINFESISSNVSIILPEGVNVTCDVDKKFSNIRNYVNNSDEEGIHTVYIIGKAVISNVEIVPLNFYIDENDEYEASEDDFEDDFADDFDDDAAFPESDDVEVKVINKSEAADNEEEDTDILAEADSTKDTEEIKKNEKDTKEEEKTTETISLEEV